jgi:hypothetical protein
MDYEEITRPVPPDGGEWLYAIIIRSEYRKEDPGIRFFTDPFQSQQLACMKYTRGQIVPAHKHFEKDRSTVRTQELILVREGTIKVDIFTSDGEPVATRTLTDGDIILLLDGGHGLTALESSQVLELKTGPYPGRELDKINYGVIKPLEKL